MVSVADRPPGEDRDPEHASATRCDAAKRNPRHQDGAEAQVEASTPGELRSIGAAGLVEGDSVEARATDRLDGLGRLVEDGGVRGAGETVGVAREAQVHLKHPKRTLRLRL